MTEKVTKMVNSPIRWVGGKSRFRKFIIPLIPEHTCYVEPFAGGAWILFGKPPSPVEVLNDIDQELINFFRILKHEPEALIASFEWELVSRAEFERLANLDQLPCLILNVPTAFITSSWLAGVANWIIHVFRPVFLMVDMGTG